MGTNEGKIKEELLKAIEDGIAKSIDAKPLTKEEVAARPKHEIYLDIKRIKPIVDNFKNSDWESFYKGFPLPLEFYYKGFPAAKWVSDSVMTVTQGGEEIFGIFATIDSNHQASVIKQLKAMLPVEQYNQITLITGLDNKDTYLLSVNMKEILNLSIAIRRKIRDLYRRSIEPGPSQTTKAVEEAVDKMTVLLNLN